MTLIFNGRLQVVEVRIHAKFHQAKCSGSRVIGVDAEKKLSDNVENDTAVISVGSEKFTTISEILCSHTGPKPECGEAMPLSRPPLP